MMNGENVNFDIDFMFLPIKQIPMKVLMVGSCIGVFIIARIKTLINIVMKLKE